MKIGCYKTKTVHSIVDNDNPKLKVKPVSTEVLVWDDYDEDYYEEFEVKPRFCNWDGSPMESLY